LTKRFRIPFISFVARRALVHAFLILLSFAAIAPLLIIWMTSLKTNTEVYVDPLALPRYWKFENFIDAWNQTHMGNYVLSSVKVSIPTIALVLVCASLAGYAFAKLRFRGSAIIFPLFLLGLMVPNISIAIPLYYTVVDIGLHDTHIGLILAEVSQALPLAIFLSRAAFLDLPGELRDAALIDGANEFDIFIRVMVPMARPAFMSVAVLAFLQVWNSYLLPLLLINTDRLQTMPLGLSYLHGRYQTNLVLLTAATTLISLPTILIYIVLQRQFIEGIVEGAIK
jgi:raffinose/stachyose/melibiose transport system permease protein